MIADVHLGYEWARGSAGDCVPAHSLDETVSRLACLFARTSIARLIVAGDLVESPRPCHRTAADLHRLRGWLDSLGVSLIVLEGNHDRSPWSVSRSTRGSTEALPLPATCTVDGWTIGHGHRPLSGTGIISGHHHPVLRYRGKHRPVFSGRAGSDRSAGVLMRMPQAVTFSRQPCPATGAPPSFGASSAQATSYSILVHWPTCDVGCVVS